MSTLAELIRCAREIAEIELRPDVCAGVAPCWLSELGRMDWEMEAKLIESERRLRAEQDAQPPNRTSERTA